MTTSEIIKKLENLGLYKVDIASRLGVSGATGFRWGKKTKPHRTFRKKHEELLIKKEGKAKKKRG